MADVSNDEALASESQDAGAGGQDSGQAPDAASDAAGDSSQQDASQQEESQPSGPIDASNQLNDEGEPYGEPDDDGNVAVIASFMDIMDEVDYEPDVSFTLPVGCVPYVSCDNWAAVVQANTAGRTFTCLGCLNLSSGDYTVLLEGGITGRGYAVSEARITDDLVAWVEVDNATDAWALYACRFTG